jgi:RimJ/RimL family protein N-acetyltransferase
MGDLDDLWPLFRLRLRTGDIELRLPDDADLAQLAALTGPPIHDPSVMPFSVPWTDESPERRAVGTLQWHWRCRAEWSPADWRLELVAARGSQIVGTQGVHGHDFVARREVDTGSWVGREYQGQGIATAMRRAVLALAFAGLGAQSARSGAFADNVASLRVSEKLGYVGDGTEVFVRRGQRSTMVRLLLTRSQWQTNCHEWPEVEIAGLEDCLAVFGLDIPDS